MAAEFDDVVIEGPLTIAAAGGETVATIMRTPGHDLELVRGLVFAEGIAGDPAVAHGGDDRVIVAARVVVCAGENSLPTSRNAPRW